MLTIIQIIFLHYTCLPLLSLFHSVFLQTRCRYVTHTGYNRMSWLRPSGTANPSCPTESRGLQFLSPGENNIEITCVLYLPSFSIVLSLICKLSCKEALTLYLHLYPSSRYWSIMLQCNYSVGNIGYDPLFIKWGDFL